jgi:TRAP-type mannitol/chloroaromatic compound transport system substrate-binding protein
MTVNRRKFLKSAAIGGAGAAAAASIAAPAIAQSAPELKWRCTSSFPKSLDTIYGAAEVFSKALAEITDNKFQVQVFAAGEIIPAFNALDAVTDSTVEMCHTCSYYFWGKDPTFGFGTAVPFMMNYRQQMAWQLEGGGMDLLNQFYAKYKATAIPCGNTGAQMGGWFRREIKTPEDMKGLKMRIGGFGGAVISKLGAVPQAIPGGDIYPSLEKGTIDAAEWVGPYDDEKLGFYKVAKYYYSPGWWEGASILHLFINDAKWASLPKSYQMAVRAAAAHANNITMARYDVQNPAALKRLIANGTQLSFFNEAVLDACFKAAYEVYDENSAKNADFKKIWDSMRPFRTEQYAWQQVAENYFDAYMMNLQRKNML